MDQNGPPTDTLRANSKDREQRRDRKKIAAGCVKQILFRGNPSWWGSLTFL
jgi:hypothetical protein